MISCAPKRASVARARQRHVPADREVMDEGEGQDDVGVRRGRQRPRARAGPAEGRARIGEVHDERQDRVSPSRRRCAVVPLAAAGSMSKATTCADVPAAIRLNRPVFAPRSQTTAGAGVARRSRRRARPSRPLASSYEELFRRSRPTPFPRASSRVRDRPHRLSISAACRAGCIVASVAAAGAPAGRRAPLGAGMEVDVGCRGRATGAFGRAAARAARSSGMPSR